MSVCVCVNLCPYLCSSLMICLTGKIYYSDYSLPSHSPFPSRFSYLLSIPTPSQHIIFHPPNHPPHPYLCSQWYGPGGRDCRCRGNRYGQDRWWRGVSSARRALRWGVHNKRLWNEGVWLFLQRLQWAHLRKQDGGYLWPCPVRCDRWGRCKLSCAFQQIPFKALIKASIEFAMALSLAEASSRSRQLWRPAKHWC